MILQQRARTSRTAIRPGINLPLITGMVLVIVVFTEGAYLPLLHAHGLGRPAILALLYVKYILALILAARTLMLFVRGRIRLFPFELVGGIAVAGVGLLGLIHIALTVGATPSRYVLYVFPFLLYLAGRSLVRERKTADRFFCFLCSFAAIIATWSVIDVVFFDETFWREIALQGSYLTEVKGEDIALFGVIGNFYFDPYGAQIRRAVGLQGDPLALAYSMALPFVLLLFGGGGRLRWIRSSLIGAAILLSLTRAIVIAMVVVFLLRTVLRRSYGLVGFTLAFFGIFAVAALADPLRPWLLQLDSSTRAHFESLSRITTLSVTDLFVGIKAVGIVGAASAELHFFESGLLNLITNYGLLFGLPLYGFIVALQLKLAQAPTSVGRALAVVAAIGLVTSLVFSESFFSFTGFGLFWISAGIAVEHYLDVDS